MSDSYDPNLFSNLDYYELKSLGQMWGQEYLVIKSIKLFRGIPPLYRYVVVAEPLDSEGLKSLVKAYDDEGFINACNNVRGSQFLIWWGQQTKDDPDPVDDDGQPKLIEHPPGWLPGSKLSALDHLRDAMVKDWGDEKSQQLIDDVRRGLRKDSLDNRDWAFFVGIDDNTCLTDKIAAITPWVLYDNELLSGLKSKPKGKDSDPESFIRSIEMKYRDNSEIDIRIKGGHWIAYNNTDLGFISPAKKTWKDLLSVIEGESQYIRLGPAHATPYTTGKMSERSMPLKPFTSVVDEDEDDYKAKRSGVKPDQKLTIETQRAVQDTGVNRKPIKHRVKEYDRRRQRLREINKKLINFFNNKFNASLPEGFKIYRKVEAKKTGVYEYKFQIVGSPDIVHYYQFGNKDEYMVAIRDLQNKITITKDTGRDPSALEQELYELCMQVKDKGYATDSELCKILST